MEHRPDMRASDAERQEVVDRLRTALDEGRLKIDEYLERMSSAYQAVTYGELAPLCADLPETAQPARRQASPPVPSPVAQPRGEAARRGAFASLPGPLKVLWTIWLTAVSINVVIWITVSATTAHLVYPWPVWVAGPWGAALLGISAGAVASRRGHQTAAPRLPAGDD